MQTLIIKINPIVKFFKRVDYLLYKYGDKVL